MKPLQITLCISFILAVSFCSWGSDFATKEEIPDRVRQGAEDLRQKDLRVRLSALEGLQSWSSYASEAVPALTTALKDESAEVRAGAAHTLELIGPPAKSAAPTLTQALSDRVPAVRAAAAFALGQIGASSTYTLGALKATEKDTVPRVALAGAFALQKLFPRQAVPMQKRREIAEAAIPLLMSSLARPRGFETVRLARAIGTISPAIGFSLIPRLVGLAYNKDIVVSSNCSYALEVLGQTSAAFVPGVLQSAQKGSEGEKISAIKQLGWMRISTPESVRTLQNSLSADSAKIRLEAAEAFSRIGTRDKLAIRELARLAGSREEPERRAAAFALLKVSPETLDELLPRLKRQDPKLAEKLEMYRLLKDL